MHRFLSQQHIHTLATVFFIALISVILFVPLLVSAQDTAQTGGDANAATREGAIGISARLGTMVGNMLLYIGSFVTGFGGWLLDGSINQFIVNIGTLINGGGLGNAINNVWVLIRDICNLAFIFGFIYVGIMTIIDANKADTKRFLASIIIGALLINFSLFIAKAVIDVSNRISVEVYNTLIYTGGNTSVARSFTHTLGLNGIYNVENVTEFVNRTNGGNIAFYFMATLLLIIAGFVFAAGAVFLMIRFVALVLILCFSPVLFAATVFPQTANTAKTLWHKLLSYSFFAPVYLLLLAVSLHILDGVMASIRGTSSMATAMAGLSGPAAGTVNDFSGVFLSFGVAIFFLIMSLQIATKFGVAGAEKTIAFGNTLRGKAQSAIGRNTIGRGSESLLKKYEAKSARDATSTKKMGTLRRFTNNTAKFGLAAVGVDDRSIRGTLEAGKKAKFGGDYSRSDDKSYADEQKKRFSTSNALGDFKNTVKNATGRKNPDGTLFDLSKLPDDEKVALERAVADASVKYLEELSQKDREAIVGFMSQSQVEGLEKSDALTDDEKSGLSTARKEFVGKIYNSNKELLSKANADSLAALGADYFTKSHMPENVVHLTSSQMDDLKKKFTPTEYAQISKNREDALMSLASGGAINSSNASGPLLLTQDHLIKQKPGEIAKMPAKVLKQVATKLPVAAIAKIAQDGALNKQDQAEIRQSIVDELFNSPNDPTLNALMDWLDNNPYGKQFGR